MKLPMTATTPSTHDDQRVRLVLEAEVWKDSDGGPDTLCLTTDVHASEPVSPARMLGIVAEARAKLDDIERIAKVFEARDTLAAILAEQHAELEEWDTESAPPVLREVFMAAAVRSNGQMTIIVPAGQGPIERADAVAAAVNNVIEQAAQA